MRRKLRGNDVLYWQVTKDKKSWWTSNVEDERFNMKEFVIDKVYFSNENVNASTGALWWKSLVWVIGKGEYEGTVWSDDWSSLIEDGVNFQEGDLNQYESIHFTKDFKEIYLSFTIKSVDTSIPPNATNEELLRDLKFYFSDSLGQELTYRNINTFYYKYDNDTDTFYGMGTFTVKIPKPETDILNYVITLNVRNGLTVYGSDTFSLNLYKEFIDENHDGLDDNTGLPKNESPDDENNWDGSDGDKPPGDGYIPGADKDELSDITLTESVGLIKNSIVSIQGVISSMLSVIPPEMASIIWAGVVIIFVLALVKLVF